MCWFDELHQTDLPLFRSGLWFVVCCGGAFESMQDVGLTSSSNLIGSLLPVLETLVDHEDSFVRRNASLSLFKIMVVSGPKV